MADVRVEQGNSYLAECIAGAKERVVLVSFMLTSLGIVRALCRAASAGRSVSVLTLPSDMVRSADAAAVDRVKSYHEELKSRGRFEYADLEIGEPRRTTTSQSDVRSGEAVGRKWYALHAKFLVTDNSVVMTSANCGHQFAGRAADRAPTDENQWEVHWRCDNEALAADYAAWYERLSKLLRHGSEESLWQSIGRAVNAGTKRESLVQEGVESYRLTDYPLTYTGSRGLAQLRHSELLVFPFSACARDYLHEMIGTAHIRLWLCAETLTDPATLELLLRAASQNPRLEIRLLTGKLSGVGEPGLKARIKSQFLPALSAVGNCEWRELDDLHAKMWVVDEAAAIGSVNPNKMNLGYAPRRGYWRSSVEAMQVVSTPTDVKGMAEAFGLLWQKAAPASGWDDVDWYANAIAGRALRPAALAAVRSDVAAVRAAYYRALADAARKRLA
jgi:phosphatidylserine/phosphatidylglycerophosphate/cardiolipin synthase-like enzyme